MDNGSVTTRTGLLDAEHTRTDGYQHSSGQYTATAGIMGGRSQRFDGNSHIGYSAWVVDANVASPITTRVGFFDAEHTNTTNNYQYSYMSYMYSDAGLFAGYSQRFAPTTGADIGRSAWIVDGSAATPSTIRVGMTDATHTRSTDGYQYSYVQRLNNAGLGVVQSSRYDSAGDGNGFSLWAFDGTTTSPVHKRLGFVGSGYTGSSGYQYSYAYNINQAGLVTGTSYRYDGGGIHNGQVAWVTDATAAVPVMRRLGLTDANHTNTANNYQSSTVRLLTESGYVGGESQRQNGSSGLSAWVANANFSSPVSHLVGLYDTEHSRGNVATGNKSSSISSMLDSGVATGYSTRYAGTSTRGRSAWGNQCLCRNSKHHPIGILRLGSHQE